MLEEVIPYLLSTAILIASIAAFFALARGCYTSFGIAQIALRILVAIPLLASAIYIHFLHTNEATAMLPPAPSIFPSPGFMVRLTGILEILGAIALFVPRLRRSAAVWIAIMMVLIFPVNINTAGQIFFGVTMPAVPIRLAAQALYIWMVLLAGYGRPQLRTR